MLSTHLPCTMIVMCTAIAGEDQASNTVREVVIDSMGGRKLDARLAVPAADGNTPYPVAVIAPGAGYHMNQPLIRRTFDALADEGWCVLRFDWAFHTAGKSPSVGLIDEIDDLRAALAYVRKVDHVDPRGVFLIGKSLGSLAAIAVALNDRDLAGVVLLTVALHPPGRPGQLRPLARRIVDLTQPVLVVTGSSDPLCDVAALKRLLAGSTRKPVIKVVPGNHRLEVPGSSAGNDGIQPAVHAITDRLNEWRRRRAD